MMGQSEAEFDRALGAWEDRMLNSHLAEEEAWEKKHGGGRLYFGGVAPEDL